MGWTQPRPSPGRTRPACDWMNSLGPKIVPGRAIPDLQPVTGSGGYTGLVHKVFTHGYNVGATWVHTFSGTSVMTLEFGRDSGNINQFTRFVNASPTFWQQVGFSPNFAGNFIGGFSTVPSTTVVGFLGSPDP